MDFACNCDILMELAVRKVHNIDNTSTVATIFSYILKVVSSPVQWKNIDAFLRQHLRPNLVSTLKSK